MGHCRTCANMTSLSLQSLRDAITWDEMSDCTCAIQIQRVKSVYSDITTLSTTVVTESENEQSFAEHKYPSY